MPIFTTQLGKLDGSNPVAAIKAMADHIRYIQEQLEWTLTNLDSSNVTEIQTDVTNITSSTGGGASFSGTNLQLTGPHGESFIAGMLDGNPAFQFKLNGRNGQQIMYLTSAGDLIITKSASLTIDCGEW